jgi:transposase
MGAEPWFELIAELRAENARLRAENAALRAENEQLKKALQEALARIEELERGGKRQAAPFGKDEQQKIPREKHKKRGRKKGHRGANRPVPDHVDEEVVVPLHACPQCGGAVENRQPITQYIEELPEIKPVVTRLTTFIGTCPCCGEVHSTHPLQTSFAIGAAKVMLGPQSLANIVDLKTLGLSLRKISRVFSDLFHTKITVGGIQHILDRAAGKLEEYYAALQEQIRASRVVYADETSWYVGERGHWLWVFTTPECTLYHVNSSRGGPIAEKILGADYSGVLVTDCHSGYLRFKCAQAKCIAHHLVRLKHCRKLPKTKDPTYLDAWRQLWKDVLSLHKARDGLSADAFDAARAELERRFDTLLAQEVTQPGDQKFRTRMKNLGSHRLTCLYYEYVEATNNRAERAIRPAVIQRKISCGNRTAHGAHTWEVLTSLAVTAYQQGRDFVRELATQFLPIPVLAR